MHGDMQSVAEMTTPPI